MSLFSAYLAAAAPRAYIPALPHIKVKYLTKKLVLNKLFHIYEGEKFIHALPENLLVKPQLLHI